MKSVATIAASALLLVAAAPPMSFTPSEPVFKAATEEYRRLWCDEGPRIVDALEEATGHSFPATPIEVFVGSATPMTSYDGRMMLLKASYPLYYKRATLVHELGHRLAFTMPKPAELDDHRLLNLFLHDVWSRLYGHAFADRMAQIESRITGRYDYAGAWKWALAMTPEQRRERLKQLRPAQRAPLEPISQPTQPAGCA